jgi:hypothetical protein
MILSEHSMLLNSQCSWLNTWVHAINPHQPPPYNPFISVPQSSHWWIIWYPSNGFLTTHTSFVRETLLIYHVTRCYFEPKEFSQPVQSCRLILIFLSYLHCLYLIISIYLCFFNCFVTFLLWFGPFGRDKDDCSSFDCDGNGNRVLGYQVLVCHFFYLFLNPPMILPWSPFIYSSVW